MSNLNLKAPKQLINLAFLLSIFIFVQSSQSKELKLVTETLPPYQYFDDEGNLQGFSIDVVKALEKQVDMKFNIEVLPWARAYRKAREQKNIAIFSIIRTQLRENQFLWIGKLEDEELSFFSLKRKKITPIKTIEDLRQYDIAVTRDSAIDLYLSEKRFDSLLKVKNIEFAIKLLLNDRVDLIYANKVIVKQLMKINNQDFSKLEEEFEIPELNREIYIALNKDSDKELEIKLRNAYEQIRNNQSIEKMKVKWNIQK